MRDQDTGQRDVRGGIIDQNISILIDIWTIISYRHKHKYLLDQAQYQHKNTQSLFPASPSCIICFSFSPCSWKSAHRQFVGYIIFLYINPVSLKNSGLTHVSSRVISLLTCFVVKRKLRTRQSCWRFFLLLSHAVWNPLSPIHRARWTQQQLNATPVSHTVWKQRGSDEFENRAVWNRHKLIS